MLALLKDPLSFSPSWAVFRVVRHRLPLQGRSGNAKGPHIRSQDTQPPLTPSQGLGLQRQSTGPNSCSTGPALWKLFRKSAVLQGKGPGVQGTMWPKYRYWFSCLKVRGGSLPSNKRFSKMISWNAKNLGSALLAEPHVAVMFSCRTLTPSEKVSCRTVQIAEPNALNLGKDYLAEPRNAGSFRICPKVVRMYKTPTNPRNSHHCWDMSNAEIKSYPQRLKRTDLTMELVTDQPREHARYQQLMGSEWGLEGLFRRKAEG